MATRTPNLGLSKAEVSDAIRSTLTANNGNFDILDDEVGKLKGKVQRLQANQITGTASGTEIEITDSANMESTLYISGNSEQDSRSGKNLFNLTSVSGSNFDIEPTLTNGIIHVKGTNNASYPDKSSYQNGYLGMSTTPDWENDTTYYISAKIEVLDNPKNLDTSYFMCYIGTANNFRMIYNATTGRYEGERVIPATGTLDKILNLRLDGCELNVSEVMIAKTANEDYEEHGAMPSPDYPSEIRSVKSKSDNLFDKSKTPNINSYSDVTQIDNGIRVELHTAAGTSTLVSIVYAVANLSGHEGKRVRVKCNFSSPTLTPLFQIGLCSSSGGNRKQIGDAATISGTELSFVVPTLATGQNWLCLWLYPKGQGGTSASIGEYADFTNIMVTIDSEIKNYQPHGYVPLETRVEGNNLVNNTLQSQTKTGVTVTVNEDKSITLNGTCTATSTVFIRVGEDIVLPAGTYTLANYNKNATGSTFLFYDDNNNFSLKNIVTKTFETEVTITPMIRIGAGATINNETISPAILRGTYTSNGALPKYEPGKEIKTISLPLGDIELRSVPETERDAFERVNGVWNKVTRIESYTPTGEENWWQQSNSTTYGRRFDCAVSGKPPAKYGNCLCSHAPYNGASKGGAWVGTYPAYSYLALRFQTLDFESVTDFKTWLASNPVQYDYVLATPIYTPITDEALIQALDELEQLVLHKGYNRITVTALNGVKAYLDLNYVKDINNVLDNINAKLGGV